jgi:hypothetical protein
MVWFSLVIVDWITGRLAISPVAACTGILANPLPKRISPRLVIDVIGTLFILMAVQGETPGFRCDVLVRGNQSRECLGHREGKERGDVARCGAIWG